MKACSMDLRERVLADCDAGMRTKPVAQKYGVSGAWVRWLKKRRRETGDIRPRVSSGRRRKIDRERLATLVQEDPDATLAELRERLGIQCSVTAIWMALDALRITFKKSRCAPANKTGRTSRCGVKSGKRGSSGSTRGGSCSSTKPEPRRT